MCKKLSFLSENFRVLYKYKAKVAMGATEGTVQEGTIPTWMKVVFIPTFLVKVFQIYFFKDIYDPKKQFDWWKEIL